MNSTKTDKQTLGQCIDNFRNPSSLSIITTTAITAIACIPTVLLNALVIIAVKQIRQLRSIPIVLMTSLAAVDLLIGIVAQPLFCAAGIFHLLDDYETMCILVLMHFFVMHLVLVSIYHLTAMAWERYVAITKTIKYKSIVTSGRLQMCAIACWVSATIPVGPSALYVAGIIETKRRLLSQVLFIAAPQAICVIAITVFYVLIYLETRKPKLMAVPGQPLTQEARNAKIERQVAKTTFLLTISLLISFTPSVVFPFAFHLLSISRRDIVQWVLTFNMLNSHTNPILYFYRNPRLRKAVLEMLNIRKPAENQFPRNEKAQDLKVLNVTRPNSTRAKLNVLEPIIKNTQTPNAVRPKTAPIHSHRVMAWHENSSVSPTRRFPGAVSRGKGLRQRAASV